MCTVQTLMFAPPGWIVSSTIEPNLSNSYPCNNPSPSASATVIVVHQSLTAGQGLAAVTTAPFKGRATSAAKLAKSTTVTASAATKSQWQTASLPGSGFLQSEVIRGGNNARVKVSLWLHG